MRNKNFLYVKPYDFLKNELEANHTRPHNRYKGIFPKGEFFNGKLLQKTKRGKFFAKQWAEAGINLESKCLIIKSSLLCDCLVEFVGHQSISLINPLQTECIHIDPQNFNFWDLN